MSGMYGELIPVGGGDPIPLLKMRLLVGRRESCDIVLRFANVSAHHCELFISQGYWHIKDLGSTNGVKVNGVRTPEHVIEPNDTVRISKHEYTLRYDPKALGAVGPPPVSELEQKKQDEIFGKSLLERAGLARRKDARDAAKRYNPFDDRAGQIKDPNRPT
jgi:adenylate cyclase